MYTFVSPLYSTGTRPSGMYKQQRLKEGRNVIVNSSVELPDSMALLILEDYSIDLEKRGSGKRRLQLEMIKVGHRIVEYSN